MTLNDILTKQNVITKLILSNGDKELSKELKVKIMRIRLAYTKVKNQFDSDTKEFTDQLVTEEFRNLANKENRTEEEEVKYKELNDKANSEYQEYLIQKGLEEVKDMIDDSFTEDEYFSILDINSGNNVEINGNKINATDFMEIVYNLFVNK